jgi:hypothetical protein
VGFGDAGEEMESRAGGLEGGPVAKTGSVWCYWQSYVVAERGVEDGAIGGDSH